MTSSDAGNRDVTRQLHQVKSRLGASGRTQAAIDLHLNGMRFRVRVMRRDIECPVEAHEVEPTTVSPGRQSSSAGNSSSTLNEPSSGRARISAARP
jgi:hypothetical protein